jgi:hypothetical protein
MGWPLEKPSCRLLPFGRIIKTKVPVLAGDGLPVVVIKCNKGHGAGCQFAKLAGEVMQHLAYPRVMANNTNKVMLVWQVIDQLYPCTFAGLVNSFIGSRFGQRQ